MSKIREKDWNHWHEGGIITNEAAVATNELRPLIIDPNDGGSGHDC